MEAKILGAVQLIGAILAVILAYMNMSFWAVIVFALIFVITGIHHFTETH